MKKIKDTFNYEIKDVAYEDSYTSGDGLLRCVFMLNGKDILEIVREASGRNVDLHHTTLCDLWAFDLSGDPYQPGRIHPLICSCDELGCANIKVRVTENEDSVIWDDFRHGDAMDDDEDEEEYRGEKSSETEDLKLSFEFEKNDYKKKMEKLRSLACASCRR